jgi:hypothetical protein
MINCLLNLALDRRTWEARYVSLAGWRSCPEDQDCRKVSQAYVAGVDGQTKCKWDYARGRCLDVVSLLHHNGHSHLRVFAKAIH